MLHIKMNIIHKIVMKKDFVDKVHFIVYFRDLQLAYSVTLAHHAKMDIKDDDVKLIQIQDRVGAQTNR